MFGKKGFVNFLEMVIVIIALFIAFSIFFPGFSYKSRWSDTLLVLKNRDILLTADRTGNLYNYSFNSTNLQNFLDNLLGQESGVIAWSETEGTFKSRLLIACNCTSEDLNNIISWFKGLRINDRDIDILPCYTNLEKINPCLSSSDVLLVFGNKSLSSSVYLNTLKEYLKSGSGIVEVADWDPSAVLSDTVQQKIFGLGAVLGQSQNKLSEYDEFRDAVASPIKRPINATVISYQPWKYFYHIPIPLFASPLFTSSPPLDNNLPPQFCSQLSGGKLAIQSNVTDLGGGNVLVSPNLYKFWICDSTRVFFDTDLNDSADVAVDVSENFDVVDYYNNSFFWNFSLNYIDGQDRIGLSFKPNYRFSDFITFHGNCPCPPNKPGKCPKRLNPGGLCAGSKPWANPNVNLIDPGDGNLDRILIQASNKTASGTTIPGVILNVSSISRVAWMANFTQGGVGDDERLLFLSLLLWASNTRTFEMLTPEIKLGFKTSYLNSFKKDMFEVYEFTFGLGYPF